MTRKIEKEDLYECLYCSSEFALVQEQLFALQLQEQNIRITEALLVERRKSYLEVQATLKEKLSRQSLMLEQKYGVRHQNQIDWETGEIIEEAPSQDHSGVSDPHDRNQIQTDTDNSESADRDGTAVTGSARAAPALTRGAENPRSTVGGI